MTKLISNNAISRRKHWVNIIQSLSGNFEINAENIDNDLGEEIKKYGVEPLINHLRLCGNIPELYKHDSSEEKLYSKYTDSILSYAYQSIGLKSIVLTERADFADVDVFARDYSFVADAKAFRLSRTAKNQKDFKVQALDGWKHGKLYAMVVCPIYQLPNRSSQIYQQASVRNVCIFTYSHLSLLVNYAVLESKAKSEELLHEIFKTVPALNPSKSAVDYWLAINKTMLNFAPLITDLWQEEKKASLESIRISKEEALTFLSEERAKIMRMTHKEAINELINISRIENKIKIIKSISDNGLFAVK